MTGMDQESAPTLPTDELMPFEGGLVRTDDVARGWGRSMSIASARLDELLAMDMQAMDLLQKDEVRMWSLYVPVDGRETKVEVDYVCRTSGRHSRMLRVKTPRTSTMLLLDLDEAEVPQGWSLPDRNMRRHHAQSIIRQFSSLFRSLAACAGDLIPARMDARLERGAAIARAMARDEARTTVRFPWALGDGLVVHGRATTVSEPLPAPWAGARMSRLRAVRDSTGLLVSLSPVSAFVDGPTSVVESMRAVNALPPLALAAAA